MPLRSVQFRALTGFPACVTAVSLQPVVALKSGQQAFLSQHCAQVQPQASPAKQPRSAASHATPIATALRLNVKWDPESMHTLLMKCLFTFFLLEWIGPNRAQTFVLSQLLTPFLAFLTRQTKQEKGWNSFKDSQEQETNKKHGASSHFPVEPSEGKLWFSREASQVGEEALEVAIHLRLALPVQGRATFTPHPCEQSFNRSIGAPYWPWVLTQQVFKFGFRVAHGVRPKLGC